MDHLHLNIFRREVVSWAALCALSYWPDIDNVGAYAQNQVPTASSSSTPSIGRSQLDGGSIPPGANVDPDRSSVVANSINPPTPSRLESAVGPPFEKSLTNNGAVLSSRQY